ncbi:MAG: phosphatidate cytidylyltransferase [Terriglobia bacterium]
MKTRVLTGIAILLPAAYLIGWSPQWLFMAVLIILVERGLHEYFFIARQAGLAVFPAVGYIAGAIICLLQWPGLRGFGALEVVGVLAAILTVPVVAVWITRDLRQYLTAASITLMGIFYVALTFSCLFPLRFSSVGSRFADGRQIAFFLFAVICVGDIFAYLTGRALGRRRIFPRVSPKKTFEGAAGGFVASIAAGFAYAQGFWQTTDWKTVILLAGSVALAGQLGDLVESALKRGANLKDSGSLLPGHGGLLDRIDSLLFGAPVLWLALTAGILIRK